MKTFYKIFSVVILVVLLPIIGMGQNSSEYDLPFEGDARITCGPGHGGHTIGERDAEAIDFQINYGNIDAEILAARDGEITQIEYQQITVKIETESGTVDYPNMFYLEDNISAGIEVAENQLIGIKYENGQQSLVYVEQGGTISELEEVEMNDGYGNFVRITHPDGEKSTYAHMSKIDGDLQINSTVSNGTRIGWQGESGNVTGVHLHFEVYDAQNNAVSVRNMVGLELRGDNDEYDISDWCLMHYLDGEAHNPSQSLPRNFEVGDRIHALSEVNLRDFNTEHCYFFNTTAIGRITNSLITNNQNSGTIIDGPIWNYIDEQSTGYVWYKIEWDNEPENWTGGQEFSAWCVQDYLEIDNTQPPVDEPTVSNTQISGANYYGAGQNIDLSFNLCSPDISQGFFTSNDNSDITINGMSLRTGGYSTSVDAIDDYSKRYNFANLKLPNTLTEGDHNINISLYDENGLVAQNDAIKVVIVEPFPDIIGHESEWWYRFALELKIKNIIIGTPNNSGSRDFDADGKVTINQFVKFAVNSYIWARDGNGDNTLHDFYECYKHIIDRNIHFEYEGTTYSSYGDYNETLFNDVENNPLKRNLAMELLMKIMFDYDGTATELTLDGKTYTISAGVFDDENDFGIYTNFILMAHRLGLINGECVENGTGSFDAFFRPLGTLTRAATSKIVSLGMKAKSGGEVIQLDCNTNAFDLPKIKILTDFNCSLPTNCSLFELTFSTDLKKSKNIYYAAWDVSIGKLNPQNAENTIVEWIIDEGIEPTNVFITATVYNDFGEVSEQTMQFFYDESTVINPIPTCETAQIHVPADFATIQEAHDYAKDNFSDEEEVVICVASGTYNESLTFDRDNTWFVTDGSVEIFSEENKVCKLEGILNGGFIGDFTFNGGNNAQFGIFVVGGNQSAFFNGISAIGCKKEAIKCNGTFHGRFESIYVEGEFDGGASAFQLINSEICGELVYNENKGVAQIENTVITSDCDDKKSGSVVKSTTENEGFNFFKTALVTENTNNSLNVTISDCEDGAYAMTTRSDAVPNWTSGTKPNCSYLFSVSGAMNATIPFTEDAEIYVYNQGTETWDYLKTGNTLNIENTTIIAVKGLLITDVDTNENILDNLLIYPNPSTGLITVVHNELVNSQIKVYNMMGKLIHSQTANSETTSVNLSGQSSGVYFIEVQSGNKSYRQKFVIR